MSEHQIPGILAALGGKHNVVEVAACITRLRCSVRDSAHVDETALKQLGVHGVVKHATVVQIVVGAEAEVLAEQLERLL